jgi:DNA-binding Lrp family transcriptional regulator
MKVELDELDREILKKLQEDARKSYRELAEELKVATGTIYNRIKRLTDAGVIKGYTVIVDPAKVGLDLTAIVLIQVDGEHLVEVEKEIAKAENVCSVYDITGEFDAAIIARFENTASLNSFIKSILAMPHIKRTVTSVVLNVVEEDLRVKI